MTVRDFGSYVKDQYIKCLKVAFDQCGDLTQARLYARQMTLSLIDRDVLGLIDIWETTDVTCDN